MTENTMPTDWARLIICTLKGGPRDGAVLHLDGTLVRTGRVIIADPPRRGHKSLAELVTPLDTDEAPLVLKVGTPTSLYRVGFRHGTIVKRPDGEAVRLVTHATLEHDPDGGNE